MKFLNYFFFEKGVINFIKNIEINYYIIRTAVYFNFNFTNLIFFFCIVNFNSQILFYKKQFHDKF